MSGNNSISYVSFNVFHISDFHIHPHILVYNDDGRVEYVVSRVRHKHIKFASVLSCFVCSHQIYIQYMNAVNGPAAQPINNNNTSTHQATQHYYSGAQ